MHAHNEPEHQKSLSQYTREVWTIDNGLPQNSIYAITQTADGYLWLGTQEGLVRFDGVRFTVFDKRNTPAFKNHYITALYVDRSDRLWIGTYDGGLLYYSDNTFHTIDLIQKFEHAQIHSIYEDREGGLWIAVRGAGVTRIDSTRQVSFDTTNGLVNNEAWNFCQDSKGRMWVATEEGVSIYDRGNFTSFTQKEGLRSENANALHSAPNNKMWIGTNQGLMLVPIDLQSEKKFETYSTAEGLPHRIVYAIFIDKYGAVWMGTRGGVARLFKGRISTFTANDGLSYDNVQSIFVDREDNIWIGTDGGGLNVLRNGLFTMYTTKEGLLSDMVWTVYEDSRQQMWIGTDRGLVCMNHDRSKIIASYTKKEGLIDEEIYSVTEDQQGTIWVLSANGINIIDHGRVKPVEPVSKTKDIIPSCVITDSKNRVWVATTGNGILKFENNRLVDIIDQTNGLPGNYINVVQEDRIGNIWAGSDGDGVTIITDSGTVTYTTRNGLSNNFVQTIYHDSDNAAWIGTFGGGVTRIKNGVVSAITTKQGLFDDVIFQILEDDYGRMWFTSNKGIFHVVKKDLDDCADLTLESVVSTAYGIESGLKSTECNGGVQPAGAKCHDGTLWFPTSAGAATINPRSITTNRRPPLVVLEELLIDNHHFLLTDNFVVDPGAERLEFRFTGLSFVNPKKVTFKVKLEGYDKEWYDIGTRREAFYTHLSPGIYTFRVIAANSDGVWNERGASFTFVHSAYFFETEVFYIGLGVVIVIGLYALYRYRIQSIERRQKELEYLVEARTQDLREEQQKTERLLFESEHQKTVAQKANEMKTQLVDMVAHDLKSPIISISGLTKEIQQFVEPNERSYDYLTMIQNTSKRMIDLIDDLLNISAIESGELHFDMEYVDLAVLAGIVVDGFTLQAQRKGQVIVFTPQVADDVTVLVDSIRMQEAIENLISNAIKYSPPNSEIRIGVERVRSKVQLWVADSGPGFTEEDKQRLFQKFQMLSAKPTGNEASTGLGLAIVKALVDAHKGTVSVESELGNGSKFIIELDAA